METSHSYGGVRWWEAGVEPPTQPCGDRFRPPTLPPAPPAAGGAGGLGEDAPNRRQLTLDSVPLLLADLPALLYAIAIGLDLAAHARRQPEGSGVTAPLQIVSPSLLVPVQKRLEELRGRILLEGVGLERTDFHAWRNALLRMMSQGAKRSELDAHFRSDLFRRLEWLPRHHGARAPANMYHYRTRSILSPARVGKAAPGAAVRFFLEDLLAELNDVKNYASREVFERVVDQKALAFLYAAHLATGAEPSNVPKSRATGKSPGPESTHPSTERTEAACRKLFKDWE